MKNQAPISQAQLSLSSIWFHFQGHLFPWLQEELPELTRKQQELVEVLEMMQLEIHLPYSGLVTGRPLKSRESIARAFAAGKKEARSLVIPHFHGLLQNLLRLS